MVVYVPLNIICYSFLVNDNLFRFKMRSKTITSVNVEDYRLEDYKIEKDYRIFITSPCKFTVLYISLS